MPTSNKNLIDPCTKMREVLEYCYKHIYDAAQSGVDISDFYGEMEWRIREVLDATKGDE